MTFLQMLSSLFKSPPRATPAEYRDKIHSRTALLVDMREPDEWSGGVLETATLLPFGDLRGPRRHWRDFLAQAGQREILLYCASGTRSGLAARMLEAEGLQVCNAGAIDDWAAAGWPVVAPSQGRHVQ